MTKKIENEKKNSSKLIKIERYEENKKQKRDPKNKNKKGKGKFPLLLPSRGATLSC